MVSASVSGFENRDSKQATRVTDASTPDSVSSDSRPAALSAFMQQPEALSFSTDGTLYQNIVEEDDDDRLYWYPMRIHFGKETAARKVVLTLKDKGYDCYFHAQPIAPDTRNKRLQAERQNAIYNIVFVRAMKIQLKLLKRFSSECSRMRFMTIAPRTRQQTRKIIWIPDKQMANFLGATANPDPQKQLVTVRYTDFIDKQDRRVRITSGPFKNVEGEIKRIQGHRIVVALIREANVAIGITHVSPDSLELL